MVNYIEQRSEATIMIEAPGLMGPQPAQRCGAVAAIGGTVGLEIVDADLGALVRIPTRFGVQRWYMALRTVGLAAKERFSTLGGCPVKAAIRWCRRRDGELVEVQGA